MARIRATEIENKAGRIDVPVEIKAVTESGEFEGYGSVFDVVDSHDDVVERGAFQTSLAEWQKSGRMPAMLWSHDRNEPIGHYKEMTEDSVGLFLKGQLLTDAIDRAKAVHALMKVKGIGGLSIGYMVREAYFDERTGVRTLAKLDLMEVSPVVFPSNTAATVLAVKELDFDGKSIPDEKSFERALRDAGYTKRQAMHIIADGYRSLTKAERDAGDDEGALTTAFAEFAHELKEVSESWTPRN